MKNDSNDNMKTKIIMIVIPIITITIIIVIIITLTVIIMMMIAMRIRTMAMIIISNNAYNDNDTNDGNIRISLLYAFSDGIRLYHQMKPTVGSSLRSLNSNNSILLGKLGNHQLTLQCNVKHCGLAI